MFSNVIFDWSGVVLDATEVCYQATMMIFGHFGVQEISLEEFRREWDQPYMLFYHKYIPTLGLKDEQSIYCASLKKLPKPDLCPGIKELLQECQRAGVRMVVLSGDPRENILSEIEKFDLQNIFQEINSEVHDKTAAIHEVLTRNNFFPQETLFVGDTTHEIKAGQSAGTKTAGVTWGFHYEEKLKTVHPDFIAHSVADLKEIILGCPISPFLV